MIDEGDDVFREGAVDGVAGELSVVAVLLAAVAALLAVEAGAGEPLDADTVAELDGRVLGVCADGDDDTDTLRHGCDQRERRCAHQPCLRTS